MSQLILQLQVARIFKILPKKLSVKWKAELLLVAMTCKVSPRKHFKK
jgi:hypothetical protein